MGKEKKAFIYDKRTKDFILRLYYTYREGMIKLAFSKLNDWHEAEDAVEEAFINIARNYKKIIDSEDYEIKSYLVNTVINTSYKILAKKDRSICSDTDTIEENSPSGDSAEEIALSEISYDELKSSVDELNPRYKILLNMKYMGYSNREISEKLNVKEGTVRVMLLRIRSSIKNFDSRMHDKINEIYRGGRRHRRNKLIFKTVAASAAVILLTFVFYPPLFGKANAFFFRMMNLTATDKGKYTEFRLKPDDNQHIEEFENYHYPRYIPDGYEIIVKNNMEDIGSVIYLNKSNNSRITYSFSTLNSPQQLDTENCNKEEILINNQLGLLYTKKDSSRNIIIFQNEEYKFLISGNIDVEILKEIAESIKK